ncbi:zinc-binding alcohol dehydrogenase family protein [Marinovum sp. 2_MG-2023]|uniref:zinc-binding alcohol dehydrogenase family protein n=1 Tax=unclassified Marinovum TaxID=2647166 RepID=UPI0026E482CF|nr:MULTISPECIES: zinc-binding alcohol dehydrogenase family protein [unclassified Marinovum]MDO6732850.1 zinc-binding alcohol dehydrogenase family protein [Marinovum sp. 2_MG-2023]MDO6782128.1 zinc-binding alcohol dehydrogenase family protein [Marinovum sp. 1_MG-2023]
MKAIGYTTNGAIDRADALIDLEVEKPTAAGHDILVRVAAVSVNPVDTKVRLNRPAEGDAPAILGWDAVGEVVEIGDEVTQFQIGDKVWYAGAINRPGTNSEYHLVDARIAAHAPKSIDTSAAAALPLTTLTAQEMIFDRLKVTDPVPGAANAIVIIGGAGGVGSIAIQLLRQQTDLTIIATASRPETQAWVKELGAHHVVDHSKPLPEQIAALGIGAPAFVFSTNFSDTYVPQIAEFIAPQGRFGLIDDPQSFDIMPFKGKAVSIHWELMFTRSLFTTDDIARQGEILETVAGLIDAGKVRSTATESFGTINAENLKRAHALIESGKAKGKITLEGF